MVKLVKISREFKKFNSYFKSDKDAILLLSVVNGEKNIIVRNFADDIEIKIKQDIDYALKMLRWITEYFIEYYRGKVEMIGIFSLSYCDLQYPEYKDVISIKFN